MIGFIAPPPSRAAQKKGKCEVFTFPFSIFISTFAPQSRGAMAPLVPPMDGGGGGTGVFSSPRCPGRTMFDSSGTLKPVSSINCGPGVIPTFRSAAFTWASF
jgi:hypothetical protein